MTDDKSSRQQAIASGAMKYEGRPCKWCRGTVRYTIGGQCVMCSADESVAQYRVMRRDQLALREILAAEDVVGAVERVRAKILVDPSQITLASDA